MASYPYYSPPPPPPPPCNNTTSPILSPPPPPPACNHTTSPTVSPLKSPPPPPACACNKTTPVLPPSTLPSSPPSSYYSPPSASLSPPPPPSPPHLSPPSSPPVLPPPSLPSPPRRTPPSSYSSPQPTPSPPSSESTPPSQSPRKPSKTQASPTPLLQPTTPPPSSSPYPQIHHSPQTPLHSPLSPDPPLCHCVCPSPRATPPNYNSFPPNYYDQIAPGPLFSPSDAPRTAIVTAFVSLGGVFFVAFIAVGLLSIALKKNMLNIPRPRRPNGSSVAGKEVREFQRPGKSPEHKIDVDGSDPDPELSNLQTAATDQGAQALRQTSDPSGDNQGKIDDSGPKSPKPQGEDKIQEADQEKLDKGKQPLEDNTDASPEEESKGGEEDHKKKKWRRLLRKKKKRGSKKEKDKYSGIRQVLNIGSQVVNTGCCFNPHDPEAEEQPENGDKDDKNGDKNVEPGQHSETKNTGSPQHVDEEESTEGKQQSKESMQGNSQGSSGLKNGTEKPSSRSGGNKRKEGSSIIIQQLNDTVKDGENLNESEPEDNDDGSIPNGSNNGDDNAEKPNAGEKEPDGPHGEPQSDQRDEAKNRDSAGPGEKESNKGEEEPKDSKETLNLPKKKKSRRRRGVKKRTEKASSSTGAKRTKEKSTEEGMNVITQDGDNNEDEVPELESEDEDSSEGFISGGSNDEDEKAEEQELDEPHGEPPIEQSESKDTDSAPHIEEGYNAVEEESKDSKDTLSLPKKEKPPSRKDVKNRARKPLSTTGAKRSKEKPTEGIQQMDVIAQESRDGENNEEQVPDLEPEDEDNGEGSISGGLNDGDEKAELNADEQEPDKLHGEPPSDQSETKDTDSGQHTEEGYNAVEEESRDSKNKVKYPSSSARKKGRKKSFSSNGAKKGNEERSEIFKAYNDTVKDGDNKEEQVLQSEPEDDGEGLFSGGSNNGDEVEVHEPELQNDSEELEVGDSKNDLRWRHAHTRESRSREEPLNLEQFTSTVGGHEEGSANDSLENEGGKVEEKLRGGKQAPSNTTALNLVKSLTASNVIDDSSEEMKSLGHGGNDYKDDRDKVPGPKFGGSNKDSRGRQRRSQVREEENILEKIGIATTGSGTGKALVSFDDEDDRVKESEPFASNVDSFFQQPLSSARGIDDQSLNPVTATIDDDKNVELKTLADGDYKGKIAEVHELSKDSRRIKGHTLSVQTVTARMSDDLGKELKSLGGNLEGKSGNGGSNKDVSRSGPTSRGAQQLPNLVQTLTPTNEGDPNPELLEFCEDDKESESEYLDEDMSLQEPSPGDEIEPSTEVKEHSEPQDDDGPNNADEDVEFPHVIDETSDERNCKPLCNKSEYEDRKVSQDVDAGKQMLVDSREASFPQKKRHSSRPTGKQEASTVGQVWKAGSYLVEAGQYQDDDADKVWAINESEPQNQYQELESLGSKKDMLGRQVSTRARGKKEPLNLEQLISTASTGNDSGRPMVSLDDEEGEVEELGLISSAVGSKQGLSKATALDGQDYKDDKRKLHQLKSRGSSKDLRGPGCSTQVVEGKKPFNLENIVTLASESDPGKAQASVVDEDNNGQVSEPFASEVDSYFPQLGAAARQVEQSPNLFQKFNAASIDDPVEELKSRGNKGKEAKVPELIINRDSRKADGGVRRIDLRNLNQTVTAKVGKGLEFLGGNQEGKTDKDGSNKDVPWSGQTSRGTQQLPNLVQTSTATNEDDPNPEVEFGEDDEGLESEYLDEDLSQQEPSPVDEIEPSTDDQSEFVTVVNDPEVPQFHNNEHEEPKNAHPGKRLSHPTSSQGGRRRKAR